MAKGSDTHVSKDPKVDMDEAYDGQTKAEIIRKFKRLRQSFFDTLEDQHDHTSRYARYLADFLDKEDIEEPNNISEIHKIIKEHSDFNNYDLVADMIELAGTEEEKKHLKEYLKEFQVYAKKQQGFKENTTKYKSIMIEGGASVFIAVFVLIALLLVRIHPSPKDYTAIGRGRAGAVVGERAYANLYIAHQGWIAYATYMEGDLTCDVIQLTDKKLEPCTVKKTIWDITPYEISYQPTSRGRHQLHIKVKGEHIKGSPFNVTVVERHRPLPRKFINGLKEPLAVAVNQRGEILVTERYGRGISIFSPTGEKLQSFGSKGSGPDQFHGIEVDDDGNILVTDWGNLLKFSSELNFITSAGSNGGDRLQPMAAYGVAISPITKNIAISDWENHHVQILNPDLTFNSSIGSQGNGSGQFNLPYDVAFDSAGNIYVADSRNSRIQVFTPEGKFLRQFGKQGTQWGDVELDYPTGLSIDSEDTVYVVDYNSYCVSVFTHEGIFLTEIFFGQLMEPHGITVDKNGTIYVADTGHNLIQIF